MCQEYSLNPKSDYSAGSFGLGLIVDKDDILVLFAIVGWFASLYWVGRFLSLEIAGWNILYWLAAAGFISVMLWGLRKYPKTTFYFSVIGIVASWSFYLALKHIGEWGVLVWLIGVPIVLSVLDRVENRLKRPNKKGDARGEQKDPEKSNTA